VEERVVEIEVVVLDQHGAIEQRRSDGDGGDRVEGERGCGNMPW
jgi:hypothetical protein